MPNSLPFIGIAEILELRKWVSFFSCIEGKGDLKEIHCIAQNAALFVSLS